MLAYPASSWITSLASTLLARYRSWGIAASAAQDDRLSPTGPHWWTNFAAGVI
jgi:hypothetical protein